MLDEEQLINDIEAICERYYDDVYRYLYYFTNSRADAEDLTQETFIKVLKGLGKFQQRSQLKTWVLSIAKNIAIDYYRKKRLIQFVPDVFLPEITSKGSMPELELETKENWQEVQKALHALKPNYRNVIILRGIKELSVKETAEILNCKESKVRVDYHRAMKLLNESLASKESGVILNEGTK